MSESTNETRKEGSAALVAIIVLAVIGYPVWRTIEISPAWAIIYAVGYVLSGILLCCLSRALDFYENISSIQALVIMVLPILVVWGHFWAVHSLTWLHGQERMVTEAAYNRGFALLACSVLSLPTLPVVLFAFTGVYGCCRKVHRLSLARKVGRLSLSWKLHRLSLSGAGLGVIAFCGCAIVGLVQLSSLAVQAEGVAWLWSSILVGSWILTACCVPQLRATWGDHSDEGDETTALYFITQGTKYYFGSDLSKAIDCFNTAIDMTPNYAIAWNWRGIAKEAAGLVPCLGTV